MSQKDFRKAKQKKARQSTRVPQDGTCMCKQTNQEGAVKTAPGSAVLPNAGEKLVPIKKMAAALLTPVFSLPASIPSKRPSETEFQMDGR